MVYCSSVHCGVTSPAGRVMVISSAVEWIPLFQVAPPVRQSASSRLDVSPTLVISAWDSERVAPLAMLTLGLRVISAWRLREAMRRSKLKACQELIYGVPEGEKAREV